MKILLIEDEEDLAYAIKLGLEKYSYTVELAQDGQAGLELAEINEYDLIILDLNLPLKDGLDVLKEIREFDQELKIIILSARSDYTQRIQGLDLGANDYLVKPFDFGELAARVRSLLRRTFVQEEVEISVKSITLNLANHVVTCSGKIVEDLTPKEFSVLQYLIVNKNRAVSAEELIEHIWHSDSNMFSNSIKVHMSALRKKLSKYSQDNIIVNIRGAGYMVEDK